MAKLLTGTRIYGTANVDSVLVVGNVTSNNSTSNTTGSLIVTGGMGITGNVFLSAANNYYLTTTESSYRLGWTDNYFQRSNLYGGMGFSGTYFNFNTAYTYIPYSLVIRGNIGTDNANGEVTIWSNAKLKVQNTFPSTSNTTGALIVGGGVGVAGNIWVGGTNAGANGIYTDVLRYAANGLPWVMGSGGGGGGVSASGYLANTVIIANTSGYLSNTSNLQFFDSSVSPTGFNILKANGNIVVGNNSTTNTATMLYNPTVNSIDFYFS